MAEPKAAYALRLPVSLKKQAEDLAWKNRRSLNKEIEAAVQNHVKAQEQ